MRLKEKQSERLGQRRETEIEMNREGMKKAKWKSEKDMLESEAGRVGAREKRRNLTFPVLNPCIKPAACG